MLADARACRVCGADYLGPTCLECMNWERTGRDDIALGYKPLFILSQGQIQEQLKKSMREMSNEARVG